MQLAIALLICLLNVLVCLGGLKSAAPTFWARPGIDTFVALGLLTLPFAVTALYAGGRRTKSVWLAGAVLNGLLILGALAPLVFLVISGHRGTSSADGAFVLIHAIGGAIAAGNIVYLLWRLPPKLSSAEAPLPRPQSDVLSTDAGVPADALGTCPNCGSTIPMRSVECPKCKAAFGPGSAWKVEPL